MRRVVIIRGPSGSGKSTIAEYLLNESTKVWLKTGDNSDLGTICETDYFFVDQNGQYHFDVTKLSSAHRWNLLETERLMFIKSNLVIVSNTNMSLWEVEPYINLAERYGYDIEIIRTPGPWDALELFSRNVHGVPLETLEKQINKYVPLGTETEWSQMTIFHNGS